MCFFTSWVFHVAKRDDAINTNRVTGDCSTMRTSERPDCPILRPTASSQRLRIFRALPIVLVLWILCDIPAVNAQEAAPKSCRVGAYISAIHGLKFGDGTVEIEASLWSVCPKGMTSPLETMEIVNAESITTLEQSTHDREQAVWSYREIIATVRQQWNMTHFPYDTQTLELQIEEAQQDASSFIYEPDSENSDTDPNIAINGWRITLFSLGTSTTRYSTNYGDPALPSGAGSGYSQLTVGIDIERSELSSFFKLTAIVYAAFLLILITYFLHIDSLHPLDSQLALLASALFASAINMRNATSELGSQNGLTLVDKIHILVLIAIVITGFMVVISSLFVNRGWEQSTIVRLHFRAAAITAITFIAANALLIGLAVQDR
jgi:hypothetical protein